MRPSDRSLRVLVVGWPARPLRVVLRVWVNAVATEGILGDLRLSRMCVRGCLCECLLQLDDISSPSAARPRVQRRCFIAVNITDMCLPCALPEQRSGPKHERRPALPPLLRITCHANVGECADDISRSPSWTSLYIHTCIHHAHHMLILDRALLAAQPSAPAPPPRPRTHRFPRPPLLQR